MAEELHFGRAAARLHLTVPSLSQQIKVLERQVKTPLFERDNRHVALTDAGALLLGHARKLILAADQALQEVHLYAAGHTGRLRIGLFVNNAAELTMPILERFRETHPQVHLEFVELDFAGQVTALLEDRVDVAFVRPPLSGERLDVMTLAVEPRVALVSARSDLADAEEVDLADIQGRPFIDGQGLNMPEEWTDFWLLRCERGVANAATAPRHGALVSYEAVRADIALNRTMTTVPASVARATTDSSVRALAVKGLQCEIAIGTRRDDDTPVVRAFRDIAGRTAAELAPLLDLAPCIPRQVAP